jgi:protein phosphatase
MGGLEEGSTASRLAVEALLRSYYGDPGAPREALENAVREANRAIYQQGRGGEGRRLMGSTLTALVLTGGRAAIAQVGDSRAYRYRGGTMEQVTRDHSLVRELADRGEIDELSASYAFHRNVLTRGLGLREDVAVDIYELGELAEGDTLLLSSDGLHEQVEADEMAACLERYGDDLDGAASELIRIARERGGPDNITVAIVRMMSGEKAQAVQNAPRPVLPPFGSETAGWLLPLAVFLSFAAGVVLTLIVETRPPVSVDGARQIRAQVDDALGTPRADPQEEANRLRGHFLLIRDLLEAEGR